MPPVLFQGTVNGQQQELVADGDKAGNFWILNAKTGKLVSKTPLSFQLNQSSHPAYKGANYACPNTNGGIEFNGGAYDPATNAFYVPSSNQCGKWTAKQKAVFTPGQFYLGGSFPSLVGPNSGWFNAVNVASGVPDWRRHFTLPANGSALVMDVTQGHSAGKQSSGSQSNAKPESLVFTGRTDGSFEAFDAETGKLLWKYETGASIAAPPATYTLNGKRYVIVASGTPGFLKVPKEKANPDPAHLTAFVMPSSGQGSGS